ncbi:MAG: hypothetical protein A2W52_00460 [Candidatus Taylorbacteria bacterium RIFCSPHIGHO2_02_49_25]|uniref:DOD-type homing endonuclease domain-containing protein n=1 Tax=Candidatus Taylorbacteria bacterium RIFCSPHIGHO2_02_49_25 TaxID=1802305 RepID=A0A1G2MGS2_9BACT|nr:MAG: hypothetical protein A2W52_00460 [Candidatus Taylorbacteria bacterium RIFCSPHIGHO2_02_49_25]
MEFLNKLFGKKEGNKDIAEFLPEQIYQSGTLELQDVIAPSALKVLPNSLNVSGKITRTFFVISYPRFLTEGWFAPIINLDKVFDISIFVHPVDTGKILKQFQKKVAEVQSQMADREKKGLVRDPVLETGYQDLEKLRDDLIQAQEKLFDVGIYITIYAATEEEMDKTESEVKSILESKLVIIKPALFQQEPGFRSTTPLGNDELMVHNKLNSSPLSSVFPFLSFDLTSNKGILYGVNRHNASLILFDRFSLENYNSIILAKSGSGKSLDKREVVLYKEGGNIYMKPIGSLVERYIKKYGCTKIDDELEGVINPDIHVFSFDSQMRGRWSKVSVAARKTAPAIFYTFRTKSGRKITTTADHNMLILRDGKIIAAKSDEVRMGEYIPLPRIVYAIGEQTQTLGADMLGKAPKKHSNAKWWTFPEHLLVTESLGSLLGWIASEGTTRREKTLISNTDEEALAHIEKQCIEFGIKPHQTGRGVAIYSTHFSVLVHRLGGAGKSGEKRVAPFLFNAPRPVIAAFIRAYFEGDGGVEKAAITAISKSSELISGISYLLYYFGIVARVQRRKKRYSKTGKKRTFWLLSISGQDNLRKFEEYIGFISVRKKAALGEISKKNGNTNCDIVPGLLALARELAFLFDSQLSDITDFSALKQGHDFSPDRLRRLVSVFEGRIKRFKDLQPFMQKLSDLPTIAAVIQKAEENRLVNHTLIKTMSSSWFTVKQGMPPRVNNALKIFAVADIPSPTTTLELKEMISNGIAYTRAHTNDIHKFLSLSLRGKRDDSSYEMLRTAAEFVWNEYRRVYASLTRIEEIVTIFKTLAYADLFFDPIIAIEKKPNNRDKYVYDLTVTNEVFLAGYGGMFVHNSYMAKLEILRSLMFGTDVIVMDPEREYEYLAEAAGGKYFSISLNSPHHINPFELAAPREDESADDVLRSNIVNLVGLFRILLGGLTPEEDGIIDLAITETYALKDIIPESDFSKVTPPLLSDFELVLAGMEGADSLVQRLSKYTRGTWAGFINQPSNIDINSNFIVFSLRDMEDELKSAAMYIIMRFIWNAIRKELKRRIVLIDEAWWMMKSEDTASFLLGLAKRGRKYFLGLVTITQDVDDFLKSSYGLPILTNSSMQILLKQSPTVIDKLQQIFDLTDEEKYLLLESDVGEGLFFVGLKHVAVKVIASYTEDQIITSDPSQLLSIKAAKAELKAAEGTS